MMLVCYRALRYRPLFNININTIAVSKFQTTTKPLFDHLRKSHHDNSSTYRRYSSSSHDGKVQLKNNDIKLKNFIFIDEKGTNRGTMSFKEAMALVDTATYDLVLVKPDENNPICRVIQKPHIALKSKKKEPEDETERLKKHRSIVKEIAVGSKISNHDFAIKMKKAIDFAEKWYKVRITCMKISGSTKEDYQALVSMIVREIDRAGLFVTSQTSNRDREIFLVSNQKK